MTKKIAANATSAILKSISRVLPFRQQIFDVADQGKPDIKPDRLREEAVAFYS
jgi:hypothetical protein